ncbi:MAG: radical SAM protein [Spirochaetales bacterium]|nr:radical SAM protein [Spirochaetales bacterium]
MTTGHDLSGMNAPRWIVIQLTEACNLRCRMCYEWGKAGSYHHKKKTVALDYAVLEKAIRQCLSYKPYFGFFGGEPFMYPEVFKAIKLIKEGGCGLDIPTNGLFIEKYAQDLVDVPPDRLWISLDGPEHINDRQRGTGVFQRVVRGIHKLHALRQARGAKLPGIGVTFIVTPETHLCIEEFFLSTIDLSMLDHLSIEFMQYATPEQVKTFRGVMEELFPETENTSSCISKETSPNGLIAEGLIRDRADFSGMDFKEIARQINRVKEECGKMGIYFIAYPKTSEEDNIRNYFTASWEKMADWHKYCPFPWIYAEIAANGDVTPCHTQYDITAGNIYGESILDIWKGDRLKAIRNRVRRELFPICTACARFYADPSKH